MHFLLGKLVVETFNDFLKLFDLAVEVDSLLEFIFGLALEPVDLRHQR